MAKLDSTLDRSSKQPTVIESTTVRPGSLELVRNRFTGRTYLVTSPVKLLPAPVASQPVPRIPQSTAFGKLSDQMMAETGEATPRRAWRRAFAAKYGEAALTTSW